MDRYKSKSKNHEIINKIISQKGIIENKLGSPLVFINDENKKAKQVNDRYDKPVDILTTSEEEKDELINWIIEWMHKFQKTLQPIINEF